jgi:glutamate formiminotransferase
VRTIVECVPNVSEGRDPETVAEAVRASPGVQLLDVSSGVSHRRGVRTFLGEVAALRAGVAKAIRYFKRRFRYLEASVWSPPRWGMPLWPLVAIALASLSYHRGRS